jgi:4-hydroxybenzoate polyprenyltransferase
MFTLASPTSYFNIFSQSMNGNQNDISVVSWLSRIAYAYWLFMKNDVFSTNMPFVVLASVLNSKCDDEQLLVPLILFTIWPYYTLYNLVFTIGNQITGIEEDRINKPFRPLPAGVVTSNESWGMMAFCSLAFTLLASHHNVVEYAVVWQLVGFWYNFLGGDQHWFTKNCVFITLAILCATTPCWIMMNKDIPWEWNVSVSVWGGFLFLLQDERDVLGDKAAGRNTLATEWGQTGRYLQAALFGLFSPVFGHLVKLLGSVEDTALFSVMHWMCIVVHLFIAHQLVLPAEEKRDRKSYVLLTILYVYLMFTPAFVVQAHVVL